MKRVFLLIEDFTELTFLETLLKKVGFDTLGCQSASTALEKAMMMTPEVFILSDIIKSQSSHDILDAFKKYKPNMHVVLLKRDLKYSTPHNSQYIDATVKSPIDPEVFLRTVAIIANVNEDLVIEKFHKLGLFKGSKAHEDRVVINNSSANKTDTELQFVQGSKGLKNETLPDNKFAVSLKNDAQNSETRKNRFFGYLETLPQPKVQGVDHKVAIKEMQDFRAREGDSEIKDIDEDRKNFVKALFKK